MSGNSENRQDSSVRASGLSGESMTIPLRQEEVSVDVQTVDTGKGIRVEKSVREEPHLIDEIVRRDEVDVRRIPVNRIVAVEDVPQNRYEGNTLIVPVIEEVLVVEKRLRIKEEIHITTTTHEERKSEVIPVKSEEISIERFDEQKTDGRRGAAED